jgi:ribA/ribD-fused uncharacterized protein
MSEELRKFYKARAKNPSLYDYDEEGNLVELNKEGNVIKTITLPSYRPPTYEEFDTMEKERMTAIAVANKQYEDARKELRAVLDKPDTPDSEIIRLNRKVREADIQLTAKRFPLQTVLKKGGFEVREIDLAQTNEKRKIPYDIAFYTARPFTLEQQYVRIGALPKQPFVSVEEAKAAQITALEVPVILFAEPETNDYGFLSLKWVVEIEFNGTMYNSAQQALSAELAKSFNDNANLSKIMLAETPDAIDYSVDDVPGDKDTNEIKWNTQTKSLLYDINLTKFNQYPELANRLLETKSAQLGAYEPDDTLIGIGISLDNIKSKDPVNWTGQNLLGKALMDIRSKIRADREIAQQQPVTEPRKPRRKPKVAAETLPSNPPIPQMEVPS